MTKFYQIYFIYSGAKHSDHDTLEEAVAMRDKFFEPEKYSIRSGEYRTTSGLRRFVINKVEAA